MIRNLTPHPIVICAEDGTILRTIESDGLVRLTASTVVVGECEGIPLTRTVYGEPVGLPEPVEGTLLIVSQLVKSALPGRTDLVVPAETVRDAEGRIIGCRSLGL